MSQVSLQVRPSISSEKRIWRRIPNAISLARILATPVLVAAMVLHKQRLFTWTLLACFLSDILDGLIARTFHLLSELGAFLDSTADMLVALISVVGIFVSQKEFVANHYLGLVIVLFLYLLEVAVALVRYRKISSFHTLLTRITAYTWGIFVVSLFLWGYHAWIFYLMVTVSVLASTEEILLVCLLPDWQSDVRGLYWVLTRRKQIS
jgi:phosphatidylglycerophosphate synthase